MMARFNCAWTADESRTATAGDLLIGLIICSMRCDQFELLAAQSDFRKQIQIYGELNGFFKPSWRTLLKHPLFFLCNLARLFNPSLYDALDAREIVQAMRAFQEYIEDETVVPDYWDETENNRVTAMHWSQSMGLVLCGQLNWTDEMINEKSLGRALWDYFGHMESQGLITLMTKEEIEDYHHQKNLTAEEITQQTNALAVLMAHQKEIHGE